MRLGRELARIKLLTGAGGWSAIRAQRHPHARLPRELALGRECHGLTWPLRLALLLLLLLLLRRLGLGV